MAERLTIPRHGSSRADDPDYDPVLARIGRRIEILLNGKPVRDVIAYDCRHGWIRVLARNRWGYKYIEANGGRAAEETLRGSVAVRWR